MASRGGRGGARGGGAFNPSRGLNIGGVELSWDLTGLKIDKAPAERFPSKPPPQAPPSNSRESSIVRHYLGVRDRIQDGPFYTILNDGMKSGKKRRNIDPVASEEGHFNTFEDNETYTSKYRKVRRRIPKLDTRPYVTDLFPPELWALLDDPTVPIDAPARKKRKTLQIANTSTATSKIENLMAQQEQRLREIEERGGEDVETDEEDVTDDDKPAAVEEEDDWSAVSSDSEESGDDYNAERYFDNGDDDDDDAGDPYENSYE